MSVVLKWLQTPRQRARGLLALGTVLLIGGALFIWRYTPLADSLTAERLATWLVQFKGAWWAPPAVIAAFVIGGLLFFPVMAMIAATALVFDPLPAIALALMGALANASAGYWVGARLVHGTMHIAFESALPRVQSLLAHGGVLKMASIRLLPIAPFSLLNMIAGSLHVPFRDYFFGTLLGLSPGIVALTAFGRQLRAVLEQPAWEQVAVLALLVTAWVLVSLLLQRLIGSRRPSPPPASHNRGAGE